jgi:hypothetical protein
MALHDVYNIFVDPVRKQELWERLTGAIIGFSYTIVSAAPGVYPAGQVAWAKSVDALSFATLSINTLLSNPVISAIPDQANVADGDIAYVLQTVIVPKFVGL